MNDTITILGVPTGLNVPPAMQEAQDRLLGRFGGDRQGKYLKDVIDNPNSIQIFAIAGKVPVSDEDWQVIPTENYAGTLTLIMVHTTTRKMAHIEHVVVDAGHEGKGIGAKLVQKAIEIGEKNAVSRFDLTSSPDKPAAQALYEKTGFKKRDTVNWRLEI